MNIKWPVWAIIAMACVLGNGSARAADQVLTGVKLQGSSALATKTPGETATAQLTVSASVPAGQTTSNVPNAGFTFEWPTANIIKEKQTATKPEQWSVVQEGAVTIVPPAGGDAAVPPGADGSGSQQAQLRASFPQGGRYRIKITAKASWWGGTGDTYRGPSNPLTVAMTVVEVDKLQYRQGTDATAKWVDVPNPLYVAVGTDVTFRAVSKPEDAGWPDDKPTWSGAGAGVSGAQGSGETKTVTFAQVSNSVGDTKTVTATCGNSVTAKVVVCSVNISAAGLTEEQDESPGAFVALNDDFDNGALAETSSSSGYRKGEPIMDRDRNQYSAQENDLMAVTLAVTPSDLPGEAQLTGGSLAVYLWPSAKKGTLSQIINTPKSYPINTLPKTVYVEGKYAGQGAVPLVLKATLSGQEVEDTLNVNVVTLVEKQGGQRRVINAYDDPIEFTVVGAPAAGEYRWDLDGNGKSNSGEFETGVNQSSRRVSYGPTQSASSVLLPRDAAHWRHNVTVSVELTGGLTLERPIHVALDAFYGTPLTGVTVAQRNAEVNTLGSAVGTFDSIPASGPLSQSWFVTNYGVTASVDANRLQYAPTGMGDNNGLTLFSSTPLSGRQIYAVFVGPAPYDNHPIQVQGDVSGTISHENVHVSQIMAIRDNAPSGNVWRLLDVYYSVDRTQGIDGFRAFIEAQAHLNEVGNATLGWYHLKGLQQDDVPTFHFHFNSAVSTQAGMDEITSNDVAAKSAAKILLQSLYQDIPSILTPQMKSYGWINDYDHYVRPPL